MGESIAAVRRATTYLSSLDVWTGKANLPDRPDIAVIEAFLKEARLSCLGR